MRGFSSRDKQPFHQKVIDNMTNPVFCGITGTFPCAALASTLLASDASCSSANFCSSCVGAFAPTKKTYSTARARFTAKNDPNTIMNTKYTQLQTVKASMVWYMMSVHPSREMHWKIVSHACMMLSNAVIP